MLLVASAAFRLLYAPLVPLTGDELMHWAWSRHLAPGYPEHPPLVAWLIAASTALFGTSEAAVRLVPVTAMTVAFGAAYALARELFGERAAFLGAAPLLLTPIFNAGGVLANTDALLVCFWTLTAWAVKRAVIDGRRRAWVAVGATTGLALLSKLTAVLLFPATAIVLVLSAQGRRWIARIEPYAAAALALALFSPVVWWNVQHGLFTVSMRFGHQSAGKLTLRFAGELIAAQLVTVTPLLFVWVLWGLGRSLASAGRDVRRLLLVSYAVVPFAFFLAFSLFARAGIHWPALGYATGFLAAGAATAQAVRSRPALVSLAAASGVALLVTAALFTIPLVPDAIDRDWAYGARSKKVNAKALDNIFDWGELGLEVRRELDQLSPDAFVMCRDGYGFAGLVGFYTPGRPPVYLWDLQERNGAAYDLWREAADLADRDVVIVEDRPNAAWFEILRERFDTLSEPRTVEIERGGRVLRRFYLLRGTGFRGFPAGPVPRSPS